MKIAFGYKMRSGKDTACDYLLNKYGGHKLTFAKPIYDILNYAQNIAGFENKKDRQFLQYIGTEWARNKNPNVWIDVLKKNCEQYEGKNIFLSDLRFINELDILKKNGWICVKLNGGFKNNELGNNHLSEVELDNLNDNEWHYVIDNYNSLEDFYKELDLLVKKIK